MTEWRLFPVGTVPHYSTVPFFEGHPWVPPAAQYGHAERTAMVGRLVRHYVPLYGCTSLSDLGCGDGAFLDSIRDLDIPMWGYDAGTANVEQALKNGLDVRQHDFLTDTVHYGDMVTLSEVVEHLADPHGFLSTLRGDTLIVSSPSAETDEWHYEDHAWAWDLEGYRDLVTNAGWRVITQDECIGGTNSHGGMVREQRFQAIVARRIYGEDE